jgi:exodeoxyribonuclease-3
LKLLSYNIRYGGVGREHLLAAVIRRCAPDLVILQEATRPAVVERLAAETQMRVWGAIQGQSLAFLSRSEVARREWHLPRGSRRAFLEVVPVEGALTVFGLHLSAVHSKWTERRRMRELRAALAHVERQRDESLHVLTGDFNTLAPGELLDTRRLPPRLRPLVWLSGGRVKYETIQIMHEARYVDAYRMLHTEDKGYTFPTWDPHVRLDYFFLPEPFAARLTDCRVISDLPEVRQASDHFPLAADIDAG